MPAFDLSVQPATLSRYDIVCEHSEEVPKFVAHVALLNEDSREVDHGDTVDVVHMGPPLDFDGQLEVDGAGRIPLTIDQINGIETWIKKVKDEHKPRTAKKLEQFCIDPPWDDVVDENTGVRRYRRYSCAGFVLYAHLKVDISLLRIDKEILPEVSRETVDAAYPGVLEHPKALAKLGLHGDGPWRIVLAGYVLHALDRSREHIEREPYVVQEGDEYF